jgi:hypothetical protein
LLFLRHFWFLFLALTFLAAGIEKIHAHFVVKKHPELREGYNKLIFGFIVLMGLPWLVMGVGVINQKIPSGLFFFMLQDGNPFVSAFFICLILEYVFCLNGIWFRGGVDFLLKYPSLLGASKSSPLTIKLAITAEVFGGMLAILMFWMVSGWVGPLTIP